MNVGIFFSKPAPYPFNKPEYVQAYSDLARAIEAEEMRCYLVRATDDYLGHGQFASAQRYHAGAFNPTGPIKLDLIFNKGNCPYVDIPIFNNKFVTEICGNKWKMYQVFKQNCPDTWLIENEEQFKLIINLNQGQRLARKPLDGSEGHGVLINWADQISPAAFPFLLQSFLDSSVGIPEIVKGIHDFRIAIIDGEIVYSYYRTPPSGSLVANVAQGGSFEVVPNAEIPDVLKVVEEVDAYMSQAGHRFYGIDFALTSRGPKIIEMNSQLGILPDSDDPVFKNVKQRLASLFKSIILQQHRHGKL